MLDQSGRGLAQDDGHLQRGADQLGGHGRIHTPRRSCANTGPVRRADTAGRVRCGCREEVTEFFRVDQVGGRRVCWAHVCVQVANFYVKEQIFSSMINRPVDSRRDIAEIWRSQMRELTAVELDLISGGDDMSGEPYPWYSNLGNWARDFYNSITTETAHSTPPTYTSGDVSGFMNQCLAAGGSVSLEQVNGEISGAGIVREITAGGSFNYFKLTCSR